MKVILDKDRLMLDCAWDDLIHQADALCSYEVRHHVHNHALEVINVFNELKDGMTDEQS